MDVTRFEMDFMDALKNDVKMLASKPGKMCDSLTEKIILTIAAAVIGYIFAQFGM